VCTADLKQKIDVSQSSHAHFLKGSYLLKKGQLTEAIKELKKIHYDQTNEAYLLRYLAKLYVAQEDFPSAMALLTKVLALNDQDHEALLLLAKTQEESKNISEARALYSQVLVLQPENEEAYMNLISIELEAENTEKAEVYVQSFIKEFSESGVGYYFKGRIEQSRGNFEEAEKSYLQAIELRGNFLQAGAFLAVLRESVGKKEKALETFEWLAQITNNPAFHKRVAILSMELGNNDKAILFLRNYLALSPEDFQNRFKLAYLYLQESRFNEAEELLLSLEKLDQNNENIHFYLALLFEQKNNFKLASKYYRKIKIDSPLYVESLRGLLGALSKNKEFKQAEALLLFNMNDSDLMETQGEKLYSIIVSYYIDQKNFERATSLLNAALDLYPESDELSYTNGMLMEKVGLVNDSILVMEKLILKNPKHVAALNFAGYLMADKEIKLPQAKKYLERAVKLKPNDPYIMDSHAWVLFKLGKYQKALDILKSAFQKKPNESIIAQHLAEVLSKQGHYESSREYFNKALELGPEDQKSKERIVKQLLVLEGLIASTHKLSRDQPQECFSKGKKCNVGFNEAPREPAQILKR